MQKKLRHFHKRKEINVDTVPSKLLKKLEDNMDLTAKEITMIQQELVLRTKPNHEDHWAKVISNTKKRIKKVELEEKSCSLHEHKVKGTV